MTRLVVDHHMWVYRYAVRLCGRPQEAEDLTQQTFLIAHQKRHQLRDPAKARAWLLSIVRSCFLKGLKRVRPVAGSEADVCLEEVAAPCAPDEIDGERLAAALAELSPEFRVVVLMFYFEELSYQAIAEQLGIPIGTVMSRLSRAKAHLRRRLSDASPTAVVSRGASRPAASPTSYPART
jgi:RNA polymerase sigma-70 factor (ECF subfamily)